MAGLSERLHLDNLTGEIVARQKRANRRVGLADFTSRGQLGIVVAGGSLDEVDQPSGGTLGARPVGPAIRVLIRAVTQVGQRAYGRTEDSVVAVCAQGVVDVHFVHECGHGPFFL